MALFANGMVLGGLPVQVLRKIAFSRGEGFPSPLARKTKKWLD